MIYEESGKIAFLGEPVKGQSKTTGNYWIRQQLVLAIEEENNVERRIALEGGTRVADILRTLKIGDAVKIGYSISAREWNGKWYNNLDIIYIDIENAPKDGTPAKRIETPKPVKTPVPAPAFDPMPAEGEADQDLPF